MKKFNLFAVALISGALAFTSCTKSEKSEPVVQENNIANGTVSFSLSVHVLPSSENGRVEGLADAKVTVSQDGFVSTKTSDGSGIVVFNGLREGAVSIFVSREGYLSSNNTTTLARSYNNAVDNQTDAAQTQFARFETTLFKTGAVLRGRIIGDFDYTAATNPSASPTPVKVIARVNNNALQPNVYTVNTDGTGNFVFNGLPEGTPIALSIEYISQDAVSDPTNPRNRSWNIPAQNHTLNVNRITDLSTITATPTN
ncbi:MAG: hypothetical protein ACK40G_08995 [Cytophagaceae bacterium]